MSHRSAKKMSKEIDRKGKAKVFIASKTPLQVHPSIPTKKMTFATRELIAVENNPRKTKHKRVHKRTSPGEPLEQTAPAHIHAEGKRWIKTLQKQTAVKKVVNIKKATKKSYR